ncbi:NAD-dependent epimerase/dehydratase family protein [Streptomyces sp. NPDC007264]|uniref:NAD-dependent epimerase/dehydratase family protein n=1 Tax=Streptomyces sp. NPDC007264 TaxID=3364777 RepID=UPI0036DA577D
MMWPITGGAGYIGAHVARAMAAEGERVLVLDDLSAGVPGRLPEGVPEPRRPGDAPRAVASPAPAERELSRRARHGVREMVESAWRGWRLHHRG